jgi:poly(3-hydroxybutyrate) depolymerase
MVWYANISDLAVPAREPALEKSVKAALAAFKKAHAVDAARVFLAGEAEGGLVALRMAVSDPRTFKGVEGGASAHPPMATSSATTGAGFRTWRF